MLIAYLDEFGHVGPYISHEHRKFNQHPLFGYAGFVLPAAKARAMGARFNRVKRDLFSTEIERSTTPNQWERKGSEYFSTGSIQQRPEQVRAFNALLRELYRLDGHLFYYGDQKPVGTLRETGVDSTETTRRALKETVNRLCTHADKQGQDLLILMDNITDKTRQEFVAEMYGHIFSRSRRERGRPEMLRIVEAPLHIESKLNSGIQFADWICSLTARLSHWQLVPSSPFGWSVEHFASALQGHFTFDSKIHLLNSDDIHGDRLLGPIADYPDGSIGSQLALPVDFYATLAKAVLPDPVPSSGMNITSQENR